MEQILADAAIGPYIGTLSHTAFDIEAGRWRLVSLADGTGAIVAWFHLSLHAASWRVRGPSDETVHDFDTLDEAVCWGRANGAVGASPAAPTSAT